CAGADLHRLNTFAPCERARLAPVVRAGRERGSGNGFSPSRTLMGEWERTRPLMDNQQRRGNSRVPLRSVSAVRLLSVSDKPLRTRARAGCSGCLLSNNTNVTQRATRGGANVTQREWRGG